MLPAMSDFLQIATTGLFTLVSAFGGAYYGNRSASQQAQTARREEARREQRTYAVELLNAGREWVRSMTNLALHLASPLLSIDDIKDSMATHRVNFERYNTALSTAAIMIRDPELTTSVEKVREHMSARNPPMERLGVAKAKQSSANMADLDAAFAFCDDHAALLGQFTVAARRSLPDEQV